MGKAAARRATVERVAYLLGDTRLMLDIHAGEALRIDQAARRAAEGVLRRFLRSLRIERGQVMVELALCLPFILLVCFWIGQAGLTLSHKSEVAAAAQAGASAATSTLLCSSGSQAAIAAAPDLKVSNLTIQCSNTTTSQVIGGKPATFNAITLCVSYPWSISIPLLGKVVGSGTFKSCSGGSRYS